MFSISPLSCLFKLHPQHTGRLDLACHLPWNRYIFIRILTLILHGHFFIPDWYYRRIVSPTISLFNLCLGCCCVPPLRSSSTSSCMAPPPGIWLEEGPWSKSISFFNPAKFFLVWVGKQLKMLIFPFIACLLTFWGTYKKPLNCGCPTPRALGQGWDQRPCPAAGCSWFCPLLYLTLAWSSGSSPEKPTSSALFCPEAAGSSRLAEKWPFSTVTLSQPKPALDYKSSCSASVVTRAKLFADNNITREVFLPPSWSPRCSQAVRLHPGGTKRSRTCGDELGCGEWPYLSPCRQKIPSVSLWARAARLQARWRKNTLSLSWSQQGDSN